MIILHYPDLNPYQYYQNHLIEDLPYHHPEKIQGYHTWQIHLKFPYLYSMIHIVRILDLLLLHSEFHPGQIQFLVQFLKIPLAPDQYFQLEDFQHMQHQEAPLHRLYIDLSEHFPDYHLQL